MPVNSTAHHADRIQAAIASNGAAKSALIASWRRSSCLHGLDPAERNAPERLTDSELRRARQEVEPLIQVAQSSLDRLYLAVGGVGCCVLLADETASPSSDVARLATMRHFLTGDYGPAQSGAKKARARTA